MALLPDGDAVAVDGDALGGRGTLITASASRKLDEPVAIKSNRYYIVVSNRSETKQLASWDSYSIEDACKLIEQYGKLAYQVAEKLLVSKKFYMII